LTPDDQREAMHEPPENAEKDEKNERKKLPRLDSNGRPIPQGNPGCADAGAAQRAAFPPEPDAIFRWLDAHGVVLCDDCRQAILAKLESPVCGSPAVVQQGESAGG